MADALKVMIADRETLVARRIAEFLTENGFECQVINSGKQVKNVVANWIPDFILIDLLMPECPATELLSLIKQHPILSKSGVRVLVSSSHNSPANVKRVFAAGAVDYVVKPYKVEDIFNRLVFHMQAKRIVAQPAKEEAPRQIQQGSDLQLHLMELVLSEATEVRDPKERLFNITQMLAITMKAVRASVIRCDMHTLKGDVIASSDDVRVKKITIDLARYPEVTHAVNTEKTVIIENIDFNPELAKMKKTVKTIAFNSIVVAPIFINGEVFGAVSARMDSKAKKFADQDIRFCQLIANVASLVLNSVEYFPILEDYKQAAASAASLAAAAAAAAPVPVADAAAPAPAVADTTPAPEMKKPAA
ncbi:MAG: response regulator [Bdellovibrionales bacterium]